MPKAPEKKDSETPEEPGSQDTPTPEDQVQMPPGFGFAGDSEEEEAENLEDLERPEAGEEGGEEEEEPETLTPEQLGSLRQQLADAQALIGTQGEELGRLRQAPAGAGPQGIVPVQGQPQVDPFEQATAQATEEFVRTADHAKFATRLSQITNAKIMAAGSYFQEQIRSETKAETDFFAKNADLMDGTPRSVYEGELAKARVLMPRSPAGDQRRIAADATRQTLKDLHWKLVDEDKAAADEARKLRGARGRRSRTGSQPGSQGGLAAVLQATDTYRASHRANQARTQSRS